MWWKNKLSNLTPVEKFSPYPAPPDNNILMSDFDDDFFNVARDYIDDDDDDVNGSSNVLIQSKKQLGNTISKKPNHLSSIDASPLFNNKKSQIVDTDTDDTDEIEVRGRSETRDSYISLSSGSSTRSSSGSIPKERKGKRNRSRSSSFEIENQFASEMKKHKNIMNQVSSSDSIEQDENDDFFKELELMNNSSINSNDSNNPDTRCRSSSSRSSTDNNSKVRSNTIDLQLQPTNNSNNDNASSSSSNPKRIYKIRFLSKLQGTINKSVHVKVLGKYTFESILPPALMGLVKAYQVPKALRGVYESENVILYRNESMKLFKFMNCNSLNIPQSFENEISDVEIVLVSKDDETEYERMVNEKIFYNDSILENTQLTSDQNDINSQFEQEQGQEQLYKIALLGEDNKKVYVNVRNSTSFRKLVDYYRIQKQIPKNKRITLSFDHDELDLNECIQDHDIEDEDVIDVIIK